jgi:hypothetical protein
MLYRNCCKDSEKLEMSVVAQLGVQMEIRAGTKNKCKHICKQFKFYHAPHKIAHLLLIFGKHLTITVSYWPGCSVAFMDSVALQDFSRISIVRALYKSRLTTTAHAPPFPPDDETILIPFPLLLTETKLPFLSL